ncbi:MAG: choice-of-anchor tandem repeat GloVer-containing protein, partial [Flavobacteriales bacterium]
SLIQTDDGLIYGLAYAGGIYNLGVLFEYNLSTGLYTKLLDFNGEGNGAHGSGKLLEAENGLLYGVTNSGGIGGWGTLFSFNRNTNEHTLLMEFDSATNGRQPIGGMIEAPNGKLYGLTTGGGDGLVGVLYEYDPETNAYVKKYDFAPVDGGQPHGNLMLATDGLLYGMASGAQGLATGMIFSHNPVNAQTSIVHEFTNPLNGVNAFGSLEELDGLFYGVTAFGGANGMGVLFSYDPALSTYETLVDFDGITNGAHPYGTLVGFNNGKLYGTTNDGNNNERGLVFEYTPQTDVFVVIEEFNGSNGNNPLYGELALIDMDFAIVGVEEPNSISRGLIFPNPSNGLVYFSNGNCFQADLYSITGQHLASYQNQVKIDISTYPSGSYILISIDHTGKKENHR